MSSSTKNVATSAPAPDAKQPTTTTAKPAATAPATDAKADAKVREPLACS